MDELIELKKRIQELEDRLRVLEFNALRLNDFDSVAIECESAKGLGIITRNSRSIGVVGINKYSAERRVLRLLEAAKVPYKILSRD